MPVWCISIGWPRVTPKVVLAGCRRANLSILCIFSHIFRVRQYDLHDWFSASKNTESLVIIIGLYWTWQWSKPAENKYILCIQDTHSCKSTRFATTVLIPMAQCVCPASALSFNMSSDQTLACQKRQALVPCNGYYDHHIPFIGWGTVRLCMPHRGSRFKKQLCGGFRITLQLLHMFNLCWFREAIS